MKEEEVVVGRRRRRSRTSSSASPRASPGRYDAAHDAAIAGPERLHVPAARAGRPGRAVAADQEQRPDPAQRPRLQGRVDAVQPGARSRGWPPITQAAHRRRPDAEVQVRRPPLDDGVRRWSPATRSSRSPATTAASRSRASRPGSYTVEAWHERYGTKTAEITVADDKPAEIAFQYESQLNGPRIRAINARRVRKMLVPPLCGRDRGRDLSPDSDRRAGPRHGLQPGLPGLADLLRQLDAEDGGGRAGRAQPPPGGRDGHDPDAGAGGMLTASRRAELRRLRPFGWLAVALVFVQALLGGITVMLRLPTPVSTAHTGDVAAVLPDACSTSRCARGPRTGVAPTGRAPSPDRRWSRGSPWWPRSAVYFQMVLGGLVRHSGAALACTDVPLCRGSLWPDAHPTVLIQALHRLNAVAVAALVLASSIVTLRRAARRAATCARWRCWRPRWSACRSGSGLRAVTCFLDLATVEAAPGGRDRAAGDAGADRAARRPGGGPGPPQR